MGDSLALIALFNATGRPNRNTQDGGGIASDWVYTGNNPDQPRPVAAWSGIQLENLLDLSRHPELVELYVANNRLTFRHLVPNTVF